MQAHRENRLAGMEEPDDGRTEFATDTATVGSSRKRPKAKKSLNLSTFDLNDPTRTAKVSWNPTEGKSATYKELSKTFFVIWSPLNENHLAEVTCLVDQAVDQKLYDVKTLGENITEIKDLESIRQYLMFLARQAHETYAQKDTVSSTPLFRQTHFLKAKQFNMQNKMKDMKAKGDTDAMSEEGKFNEDMSFLVPHLDEYGNPILLSKAPAESRTATIAALR